MTTAAAGNGKLTGFDDGMRASISLIVATDGWSIETDKTWRGDHCLRLVSGSRGRGVPKSKFLLVGSDLPALLEGLAACLRELS